MKNLIPIFLIFVLLGCENNSNSNERADLIPEPDKELREEYEQHLAKLEVLAFEGINIDFKFKDDKPTFGDLFLICGYNHPNFPPNSKEFEKLSALGFEQIDDYFGLKNQTDIGGDVLVGLFPIIHNEEVYHNAGPFDAIRINYVVVRNEKKHVKRMEEIYHAFKENLNVDIFFEGVKVDDYSSIRKKLEEVIVYCETELKVEPGSTEALKLDW